MSVSNLTVLITGASSGIGFATAKKLLDSGANVSTLSRRTESLEALSSENLLVCQGSVSDKTDVENWFSKSLSQFGCIDAVINNAGVMYYMDMSKPNYTEMVEMLNTNCLGFINVVTAALPHLEKSLCPHLINITSDAGKRAFPGLAAYSASKAFVEFFSSAMRHELKDKGIKITNIQPGNVDTNLHGKSTDLSSEKHYGSENAGQYLNPEDIANACLFALMQSKNAAVNEILLEPVLEPI